MRSATGTAAYAAGKKKKKAAPVNPMAEMKQMENIHDALEEEQQLRSYFQAERDKVNEMWGITEKELQNERYRLQNVESEIEELERQHQIEMKVYKQKVRHLIYDYQVAIKQLKSKNDEQLMQSEAAHQKRLADIRAERQQRIEKMQGTLDEQEGKIVEQRESHQYMIKVIKKQSHERELARLTAAYEAKLSNLRENLELRRRAEINDVEERRNEYINGLTRQHEAKFAEVKEYYNSITRNNLEVIQSLKEEIALMRKNDEQNESLMYSVEQENHNLASPLEEAERDVAELQQRKKKYVQDKQSISMTRARLRMLQEEIRNLSDSHFTLERQYAKVYEEREDLRNRFETTLRESVDMVDERNAALQQYLLEASAKVEERDAQFDAVLAAMHLEPATMVAVNEQIEHELAVKNQMIKDLHFELRKAEKKVAAVLNEYERRCNAAGLPPLSQVSFASVEA